MIGLKSPTGRRPAGLDLLKLFRGRWVPVGIAVLVSIAGADRTAMAQHLGWPMEGHDARRTSQSAASGPSDLGAVRSMEIPGGLALNMPVTVTSKGVGLVGSWGKLRNLGSPDRADWNKFDGTVTALSPDLSAAWPAPFPGDFVHYCYTFAGRETMPEVCGRDESVSFYNGTVEGTPSLSADESVFYVGRGDGKLYAVDTLSGKLLWHFETFNPELLGDPDGGGEVIAAPLVMPDGSVVFATAAAGPHETSAIYCVSDEGDLVWRYPSDLATLRTSFLAAPALSPSEDRVYLAGAWGPGIDDFQPTDPGGIYAFDVVGGAPSSEPAWVLEPVDPNESFTAPIQATSLAVGSDGVIFVTGIKGLALGGTAVAFAYRDLGSRAVPAWPAVVDLDRGRTTSSLGLALREVEGKTTAVYASSGNGFVLNYRPGGKLFALDPQDGRELWRFDPELHGGTGAMTGIALDRNGTVFTGVSGESDGGLVFAISPAGALLWSYELDGLLEWGHPVLDGEGNLWVAETRRCSLAVFAAESGLCDSIPDPKVYVFDASPTECDRSLLCLRGERFRATADWQLETGETGVGGPRTITGDTGSFWFFDEDNLEVFVKVLDGCDVNGHFWVFATGLTDVGVDLQVLDGQSGQVWDLVNLVGQAMGPRFDTMALRCE